MGFSQAFFLTNPRKMSFSALSKVHYELCTFLHEGICP